MAVANNIERKYFFMIGFVSEGKDSARRVQRKMKSLMFFNLPLPSRRLFNTILSKVSCTSQRLVLTNPGLFFPNRRLVKRSPPLVHENPVSAKCNFLSSHTLVSNGIMSWGNPSTSPFFPTLHIYTCFSPRTKHS